MSLRTFRDHGGQEWKVWDVKPYLEGGRSERRAAERRSLAANEDLTLERRSGGDRRRNASLLTPGLESGWLCFEGRAEKRRLTPIPRGWQEAAEPELESLLDSARRVSRRLLEGPPASA
jgi:hypothetical protein